jgi:uncharacterized protein (DUF2141 family)
VEGWQTPIIGTAHPGVTDMTVRKVALTSACAAALAGAQQGNTVDVAASGLRSDKGDVRCGLYNSAATFPEDGRQFMGVQAPIAGRQATCTLTNVPPGTYAIAYFHAEKGETRLRSGFFGQPEEGYGFSRNATGLMGPPDFNAAAYSCSGGFTTWPVTITHP